MIRKSKPPEEPIKRIALAVRSMVKQSELTRELIAEMLGLHKTDLEGADFLCSRQGACAAGELAKATGLTSGSTTALIDRLERAGYALREPDSNDRRRQIVRIQKTAIARCEAVYAPIQTEMFRLWSSYTAGELRIIEDFIIRRTQRHTECLERLGTLATEAPRESAHQRKKKRRRP